MAEIPELVEGWWRLAPRMTETAIVEDWSNRFNDMTCGWPKFVMDNRSNVLNDQS
jgi:hypothetical protein